MTTILKFLKLNGLILFLLVVGACNDEEKPERDQEQLITESWNVSSVTRDGDRMEGVFTIVFREGGSFEFSTPGVTGLPQQGDWKYISADNIIKLNDEINLVVTGQITDTSFVFVYTYTNHKMGSVKVSFTLRK